MKPRADHILVVSHDDELRELLVDTLETECGYQTEQASTFQEALDKLLLSDYMMALIEVRLSSLSGIDLLTAVRVLGCEIPVILIDDDLSAKSAIAAFRLGAIDYICKPVNVEFLMARIQRELLGTHKEAPPLPKVEEKHCSSQERERRIDPTQRPATLVLRRAQFRYIAAELDSLYASLKAKFVCLADADNNLLGATGTLQNCDLMLLKDSLTMDHRASNPLLGVLGEDSFRSTHFEGEHSSVYMIEIGALYRVSLIVICSSDIKPGAAWFYTKQTALKIDEILSHITPVVPKNGLQISNSS